MRLMFALAPVAAAALLAACGGSDDAGRGSLIDPPTAVTTLTTAQINASAASSGLNALAGQARCDVRVTALYYNTTGPKGEGSNASGVLLTPTGTGTGCTAAAPLLAYGRGTEVLKTRTLANPTDGETFLLAAMYAAQGYAVVASDYLGYARSTFSYHPYLHADSQATTVIDSVRAARAAASIVGAPLSGRVMLAGYSQGGHVSASAHRAIERDVPGEINVVAAAHLAGPYNLSGSLRFPDAVAGVQFFTPLLITGFQRVYGNIYSDVRTVYKAPYVDGIETLLPNPTLTYTTLVTTGKLPGGPTQTPNQSRALLLQDAFVTAIQTDANHPMVRAAQANDLLAFVPRAPTLLCSGAGDPTVPKPIHQDVYKAALDRAGATNVTSIDIDPAIQAAFGVNGRAPAPTDPAYGAYISSYHGTFAPPICNAQAKAFFDRFR
jgi:pimeloyl-ACP methyl ester carboxylesterase